MQACYVLSLLFVVLLSTVHAQYVPCEPACEPLYPACQVSQCDTAVGSCRTSPRNPLAENCCVSSDDCHSDTLIGFCNFVTNECNFGLPEGVETPDEDDDDLSCTDDSDCEDVSSPCVREFCDLTSGEGEIGTCVSARSPDSTNIFNCCSRSSDCPPPNECSVVTCDQRTLECAYRITDPECSFYDNYDRPSRGNSPNSSPPPPSSSSFSYIETIVAPEILPVGYAMILIGVGMVCALVCFGAILWIGVIIKHFMQ